MKSESNDHDEELVDLLRSAFRSRSPLVDQSTVDRVSYRLQQRPRRSSKAWLASVVAISSVIFGVFVWTDQRDGSSGANADDTGNPLNPTHCLPPDARLGKTNTQWAASTGNPVAIEGGLAFEPSSDDPETPSFRYEAVTLIVGEPEAVGSPTDLRAGVGVVDSLALPVVEGRAPHKARLVFESDAPGRYPVWVLVEGTCDGGTSAGASPVGFVEVERSVTRPCQTVEFDGRLYTLGSGPELGPSKSLGQGEGSDCEGGEDRLVNVFGISELSPEEGINVVYPGLGVRHYHSTEPATAGGTAQDQKRAEALIALAVTPNPNEGALQELNLAPGATATLGQGEFSRMLSGYPIGRDSWLLDPPDPFRAQSGPFSALAVLSDRLQHSDIAQGPDGLTHAKLSVGPHPRCVGPNTKVPAQWAKYRQVSIQPKDPQGCLDWFSVDLYLDAGGRVHVVDLDLFEP